MLSHLEISVAVSLSPSCQKRTILTKTKSDKSIGRSQFPMGNLREEDKIVFLPSEGLLRIRLRADKANLTKCAFGIGRAKGGLMWKLTRKEGEFLKEKHIASQHIESKRF